MNVKEVKEKAKDWWDRNKKLVGVGLVCTVAGVSYGFFKGVDTMSDMIVRCDLCPDDASENEQDEFVYDESNVDDPELLEMIKDGSIDE